MADRIVKTDEEWRRLLTPEQFAVCRQQGTEPPFTGAYWDEHRPGRYLCVACGLELFRAQAKYDSGSGWPSFVAPASDDAVETATDASHGLVRVEVRCRRCGAHLGHRFDDGPRPTGQRYCINSAALRLDPDRERTDAG